MFYVFPRAVPKNECKKVLKFCIKNTKFQDAAVINKGFADTDPLISEDRSRTDHDVRKTDIGFIVDKNNMVNEIAWHFLREANKIQFNYKLEYFQPVQFARYRNGGHYGWHQDSSGITPSGEGRKLSLTFCLSDPNTYEGGNLEFFSGNIALGDMPLPDGKVIKGKQVLADIRDQGSVIVFDSRDYHRVTPCTKGTRYSIVCWTVGPNFI
jgi:PKHD-type hydroxylase